MAGPALAERLAPACMVELGSGSSSKTRALLEAFGASEGPLTYVPIDVSAGMLEASARRLMKDFAGLNYTKPLRHDTRSPRGRRSL